MDLFGVGIGIVVDHNSITYKRRLINLQSPNHKFQNSPNGDYRLPALMCQSKKLPHKYHIQAEL